MQTIWYISNHQNREELNCVAVLWATKSTVSQLLILFVGLCNKLILVSVRACACSCVTCKRPKKTQNKTSTPSSNMKMNHNHWNKWNNIPTDVFFFFFLTHNTGNCWLLHKCCDISCVAAVSGSSLTKNVICLICIILLIHAQVEHQVSRCGRTIRLAAATRGIWSQGENVRHTVIRWNSMIVCLFEQKKWYLELKMRHNIEGEVHNQRWMVFFLNLRKKNWKQKENQTV